MADAPYLLALALVERNGERLLPLNGKSRRPVEAPDPANTDPANTDPGVLLFDLSVEDESGRSWDLDAEPQTVCEVRKKVGGKS